MAYGRMKAGRAVAATGLVGLWIGAAGCIGSGSGNGSGTSGDHAVTNPAAAPADPGGGEDAVGATGPSDAARAYPLHTLPTAEIRISEATFRVWLAQEFDVQRPGIVTEGLMHVTKGEIADDQGMLFVFSDERLRGFWMYNTITPLDIAFARMDGTIVKIWQMPALTLRTFSSIEPAMFALEVKQGTFAALGIAEGDRMVIPTAARVAAEP